jgi:hypothetical protein
MSGSPGESNELKELLGAVRDGQVTEEQLARLEALLAEDPVARAYYLEYISLCSTLRHYQGRVLASKSEPFQPRTIRPAQRSWWGRWPKRLTWTLVAAAALLACVLVPLAWLKERQAALAPAEPPRVVGPTKGLALLAKVEDVRWQVSDRLHPSLGTVLAPGRFRFESGRATLSFFSGVTLTLEGPADIDLVAMDRVFCRQGKLRARVPKGAEGFVVSSPRTAVIDLGTEFGLNVEADGNARVMVFEGLASAALLDAAGDARRTQLVEKNKAFAIDPHTGRIAGTVVQPQGFVSASHLGDSSLVLDPAYVSEILRSRPKAYWRFESLVEGSVPDEIPGGRPLRVNGPIVIGGGSRGTGFAEFRAGAPGQNLTTDGLWELARDPGHAVEFWFLAENYHDASLVGFYPPRDQNPPDQGDRFLHTFFAEIKAEGRHTLHKPASVRSLHRWPLDVKVENNVYSENIYIPHRWHHVVLQRNGTRMELYFDGVPSPILPIDTEYPIQSCHLIVGRRTPEATNPKDPRSFIGRLDELAIYDHLLSAEEVQAHFRLARGEPLPE